MIIERHFAVYYYVVHNVRNRLKKIYIKLILFKKIYLKITRQIVKIIKEIDEIFPIKSLEKPKSKTTHLNQPDAWNNAQHLGKQRPIFYTVLLYFYLK